MKKGQGHFRHRDVKDRQCKAQRGEKVWGVGCVGAIVGCEGTKGGKGLEPEANKCS